MIYINVGNFFLGRERGKIVSAVILICHPAFDGGCPFHFTRAVHYL
jgi:hypothetical protein